MTLAAVAAVPAALCVPISFAEPGDLASLIRRFFAEQAEFFADPRCDDDEWFLANAKFEDTLSEIHGQPVRNDADALAAVDWLIDEGKASYIDILGKGGIHSRVSQSLIHALRDYLAAA